MKDYLWIIIASVFALVALLFFILTIANSTSLIKKLKRSKANILLNLMLLLIGMADLGISVYLLQDVREQIERFSHF